MSELHNLPSEDEEQAAKLLREKGWLIEPPSEVKYGCFVDLESMEPGTKPDRCVIEDYVRSACIYASATHKNGHYEVECKEACKYWKAYNEASLKEFWDRMKD